MLNQPNPPNNFGAMPDPTELPEDFEEWEKIEAEMGAEEMLGKPIKRSATQGIADMTARIAYLRKELANIHPNASDEAEIGLIRDIADAEARLKEYQTQNEGRN